MKDYIKERGSLDSFGRTRILGLTHQGITLLIASLILLTLPSINWKEEGKKPIIEALEYIAEVDSTEYYKQQAKINIDILEYRMKKNTGIE